MSLKGKIFTADDLPANHRLDAGGVAAWCTAQTERYRIVAMDGPEPVIAEELEARILHRLSTPVRVKATEMLQQLDILQRAELLGAFAANGELKNVLMKG